MMHNTSYSQLHDNTTINNTPPNTTYETDNLFNTNNDISNSLPTVNNYQVHNCHTVNNISVNTTLMHYHCNTNTSSNNKRKINPDPYSFNAINPRLHTHLERYNPLCNNPTKKSRTAKSSLKCKQSLIHMYLTNPNYTAPTLVSSAIPQLPTSCNQSTASESHPYHGPNLPECKQLPSAPLLTTSATTSTIYSSCHPIKLHFTSGEKSQRTISSYLHTSTTPVNLDTSYDEMARFLGNEPICQLYPSPTTRTAMNNKKWKTFVKQSTITSSPCRGLFALENIKKNEIIAIYKGKVSLSVIEGPYVIELNANDGTTFYVDGNLDLSNNHAAIINEYIWDMKKNNAILGRMGIIVANKMIKKGEEIFAWYGMEYDWNHLILSYIPNLVMVVNKALTLLDIKPITEPVTNFLNSILNWTSLTRVDDVEIATSNVLQGITSPDKIHHWYPSFIIGDTWQDWFILLIHCEPIYKLVAFRYALDPTVTIDFSFLTLSAPSQSLSRYTRRLIPPPPNPISHLTYRGGIPMLDTNINSHLEWHNETFKIIIQLDSYNYDGIKLLAQTSPNLNTFLSSMESTDLQYIRFLIKPDKSKYLNTHPYGYCGWLSLQQHLVHSSSNPRPLSLDLAETADSKTFISFMEDIYARATNQSTKKAILDVLTYKKANMRDPYLPKHLWFDVTFLSDIKIEGVTYWGNTSLSSEWLAVSATTSIPNGLSLLSYQELSAIVAGNHTHYSKEHFFFTGKAHYPWGPPWTSLLSGIYDSFPPPPICNNHMVDLSSSDNLLDICNIPDNLPLSYEDLTMVSTSSTHSSPVALESDPVTIIPTPTPSVDWSVPMPPSLSHSSPLPELNHIPETSSPSTPQSHHSPQADNRPHALNNILKKELFWRVSARLPSELSPISLPSPDPKAITIWSHNIGSLTIKEITPITSQFVRVNADVVILLDSRIPVSNQTWINNRFRLALKNLKAMAYKFFHFPPYLVNNRARVGGTMILVSQRIKNPLPTTIINRGIASSIQGLFGTTPIIVIGTYWPVKNTIGPHSLWNQTCDELCTEDPVLGIKDRLRAFIESNPLDLIIAGDFNTSTADPSLDKYNITEWIAELGLNHASNANTVNRPSHSNSSYPSDKLRLSRIDYVFWKGNNILHPFSSPYKPKKLWADHRPLLSSFSLPDPTEHTIKMYLSLIPDVGRKDKAVIKAMEKYDLQLATLIDGEPLDIIDNINRRTVDICNRIILSRIKRARRSGHDGWSPESGALQIQYDIIIKAICGLNGTAKSKKWTPLNYNKKIKRLKSLWINKLKSLSKSPEEVLHWKCLTCFSWTHWDNLNWTDLAYFLEAALQDTKKRLHGRIRRTRRQEFLEQLRIKEKRATEGQIGDIVKRLKPSKIPHYGLDELLLKDHLIVDPTIIHEALTQHFHTWYAENPDDCSHLGEWSDLLCSEEEFIRKFANENIPKDILISLYKASREINIEPSVKLRFHNDICNFMTFEEFSTRIDLEGPNTAGGINGMSHNKMFHWGPNARHQVYQALNELWTKRLTPDDWKWRWLVPLPKTANPSPDQLRPLMLMDVLRKLVSGYLTYKISRFWKDNNILSHCSHAFVGGQGTHSAALQLLNSMETCKEWRSRLYMASIDMKKAFDSLGRHLQIYALYRTGVPIEIAKYMVGMDLNSITVVRSPLAYAHWKSHGLNDLDKFGFFAEQGTAQGDKPSPSIWVAVNDILATAWDMISDGAIHTQDDHGRIIKAQDIIYADDNLALAGTFNSLQRKMNLLSAFCIIFGIMISPPKSKAFLIQWGNHYRPDEKAVLVHSKNWVPAELPLLNDGSLKHLGIIWDMSTGNGEQLSTAKSTISSFCEHIAVCKSSNNMKLLVMQKCLLMAINYFAKFTTWSLQQYREIDKLVARYYRTFTCNKRDFPERLLYASRLHGGLGLSRPSDLAQKAKLSLIIALPLLGSLNHHTINSLISRGFRYNGLGTNTGKTWLQFKVHESCWISSLVEWLAELNLCIERNSDPPLSPASSYVAPSPGSDEHLQMAIKGIILKGELPNYMPSSPNDTQLILRPGQCWQWPLSNNVIEIIGFDSHLQYINIIEWKLKDHTLFLDEDNHCLGAGAPNWIYKQDWLLNPPNKLVLLTQEKFSRDGTTTASILHRLDRSSIWPTLPDSQASFPHALIFSDGSDLYSDGSFTPLSNMINRMCSSPKFKASCAVIQKNTRGNCTGIRITANTNRHNGAYFMEMLALACSVVSINTGNLKDANAAADCLAAINMTKKALKGHSKLTKCFQLVTSLHMGSQVTIRHVKAHPERRTPDSREWTPDDWGIFKADQLAGDEKSHIPSLDEEWILQELTKAMTFRIVRATDHSIFYEDLDHLCSLTNINSYIKERNTLRDSRLNTQDHRWSSTFLPLIALLHDNRVSTNAWASTLRIVWDKTWHGANKAKSKKSNIDADRCPHCNGFEDQAHIILHCPRGKEIREKLDLTLKDNYRQHSLVGQIIMMYYFYALTNHTLWTGSPDADAREFLRTSLKGIVLSNSEWAVWAKALRLIGESARQISIEHSFPEKKRSKMTQQDLPWNSEKKLFRTYRKPSSKQRKKYLKLNNASRKGIG